MMKRRTLAIVLLMLSLVVLVGGNAAAADGVDQGIRLPSDDGKGLADDATAAAAVASHGDEERPWECCDLPVCTRSIPPICRCLDTVEQCAGACKHCEEASSSPSRHVCMDSYTGWPGPTCTDTNEGDADVVVQVMAETAAEEEVV